MIGVCRAGGSIFRVISWKRDERWMPRNADTGKPPVRFLARVVAFQGAVNPFKRFFDAFGKGVVYMYAVLPAATPAMRIREVERVDSETLVLCVEGDGYA